MIKETTINTYGKYFLSFEADDDLNNDENIKFNTKIITVKPTKRRSDLYKIGDDYLSSDEPLEGEERPVDDIPQNEPAFDNPEEAPIDVAPEEGEVNEDEPIMDEDPLVQQVNSTNEEINNNEGQVQTGEEPTLDTTGDTEINTDEPVMDEEPLPDDDTGEVPPEEDDVDTTVDPNAPPVKRGPGIEYDSMRRYILFNKYTDLCNSIKTYVERLSNIQSDDANLYKAINIAIKKLNEIYNVTYDYIIMKFELSSYVQSLLFYQERIVNISKVFDLINEASLLYQKEMKKKK